MLYLVEPEAMRELGAKVAALEKLIPARHRWEAAWVEPARRELRALRELVAGLTKVLDRR